MELGRATRRNRTGIVYFSSKPQKKYYAGRAGRVTRQKSVPQDCQLCTSQPCEDLKRENECSDQQQKRLSSQCTCLRFFSGWVGKLCSTKAGD
jgi:hypothetical protein